MKELKFEDLTLDQKLGLVHTIKVNGGINEEGVEFIFNQIKARAVGAVWIQHGAWLWEEFLNRVKETADYPILIMTDAENGIDEFTIGRHSPIGCTGDEKYAYAFGKAVGFTAKKLGYNVVCNPVLDTPGVVGFARSYGEDVNFIAKMGVAEARGLHDAGVLSVAKHYPSPRQDVKVDTHMAEAVSYQTSEELLSDVLLPYLHLVKEGVLDGVMTSHVRLPNVDDVYPASLSKKVIDIFRNAGFEGFCMTDALNMMGIRAKFGEAESLGLAIAAGNELPLPFTHNPIFEHNAIREAYEKGVISAEHLDICVKRILAAQHKVMELDKSRCTKLTEEEIALSKGIIKASIYEKADEGVSPALSRDGKHLFAVMTRNEVNLEKVDVDTFTNNWHFPSEIAKKLKELFPNSDVMFLHEFSNQKQNYDIFQGSITHDDVIFLTFSESIPYVGKEALTTRVVSLIEALQLTNRVSTLVHFGNPCILDVLPHISRIIVGGISTAAVDACIDVMAGLYEATGQLTCEVDFK